MSKKILFMSNAKLSVICTVLLLAVFCTIGMSFTRVEAGDIVDPNDSTALANRPGPRRSHYYTSGCFGDSPKDEKDYAKTFAITRGNGSVQVTAADGANVTSTSEASGINDGDQAYIEWNCGATQVGHTKALTFTASRTPGYLFYGWSKTNNKEDIVSTAKSYTAYVTIPFAERAVGDYEGHPDYEDSTKPWDQYKLYAFFEAITPQEVTFIAPQEKGSYELTYQETKYTVSNANREMTIADAVTLKATPNDGYIFAGWYQIDESGTIQDLGNENPCEVTAASTLSFGAHFVSTTGHPSFLIKETSTTYHGLKAATMAAKSNQTIIPVSDCVIDGSDLINENDSYTIGGGVTFLIPYASDKNTLQRVPTVVTTESALAPYRTVTLTENAKIIVNGELCVAGQIMSGAEANAKSGYPTGTCGMLDMSRGGYVEVNDGGKFYAWGIVKGQDQDQGNNTINVGTIVAHQGSVIWEDFQVGDFRGGTACANFYLNRGDDHFFPFQSYNVCNIEAPIVYEYGSTEKCYLNIYANSSTNEADFTLVGSEATLFLLKDKNSSLRKWYDPTLDLMCYEMSGTTELEAIQIGLMGYLFNSADFLLPVSSNMKIIMSNTHMTLSSPIAIHAGAQIEIKNTADVSIDSEIYLFDNDQWDKWVKNTYFRNLAGLSSHKYRGDGSTKTDLDDAKFIVDGILTVSSNGKIFSSASGADLMGNGGGRVIFAGTLPESTSINMYKQIYENPDAVSMSAVNLRNENGSYTRSIASATFHNVNGRWFVEGKENEKADHTFDFTYMSEGNTGDDVDTLAVYSTDKTSLEAGYKWANVEQDETCTDNYNAADDIIYNYTKNNAWTQFIPDERPYGYSGSDNKLYTKVGCVFSDPVAIDDETCLYPFEDGNKALVNGTFIALTPNDVDAAYRDAGGKYYICFKGCNWHEATPYEGELKTYNVVEGGTYIWYNSEWTRVERGEDDPFFYTTNEQNVKTYYEYKDGEWIIALPYVTVTYGDEERNLFSLADAFAIASTKKDVTITINRDFTNITAPFSYAGANTTCTLDLNGHTATIHVTASGTAAAVKMCNLNGAGSTFTITDNSGYGTGQLRLLASVTTASNSQRWHGIYVSNGSLVMEGGKLYVENAFTYSANSNTGMASAITVGAGNSFTMNNGEVEAKSPYSVRGVDIQGTTNTSTIAKIKGGTISATTTAKTHSIGVYVCGGKAEISGGIINATTESTTSRGIYVEAATTPYYGTLTMTGGTVNVIAKGTTAIGVFVQGTHTMKNKKPNTINKSYLGVANISGGTFNVTAKGASTTYGIQSNGNVTISGNTVFNVTSIGTTAYGLLAQDGTITLEGTPVFTIKATSTAYGVFANGISPDTKSGRPYNPKVIVKGGTINVETTSTTTAYGFYVNGTTCKITSTSSGYYAGNYASAGEVTVNDGTFNIKAKTDDAYGFVIGAASTQSGATDYAAATATPKCTVNGGKFKVSAASAKKYATNAKATAEAFKINGGYFNNTSSNASGTTLSTYIVSPKTAVALTDAEGNCPDENYLEYTHKVAEAYLITFMKGEEQLQSTWQNAGAEAVYNGLEPTKDDDGDNSYEFDGWASAADAESAEWAKGSALPSVSAAATSTYYAHFATTAKKYIITWNANGGTCATELTRVEATGSATVGTLPEEVTKAGYDFEGWFTEADGGTPVTEETVVTGHVTYYAHYTVHSHTLTWDANGGAIAGTYTHGSVNYGAAITAPENANVVREGYTFAGWDATPVTTMPDNNLTYTAQWTAKTDTDYKVLHKKQNRDNLEEYTTEIEEKKGTTASYVTPATKSYPGWKTPTTQTKQIAADRSMEVIYIYDCITYDIAFDAATNGGTCTADPITNIVYGKTIGSRIDALPAEPEVAKAGNVFVGWFTKPVGGEEVTLETEVRYNIGSIYAQFRANPVIEVGEAGTEIFDVTNKSTVDNVIVHSQGKLVISTPSPLTTNDLVIEASPEKSGEIIGNVVADNVYFDLTRGAGKVFKHHTWYAFSVPFQVDAAQILFDGQTMQYGQTSKKDDYDILYYDGSVRATSGKDASCWKYVEKDDPTYLYPGKLYMIANTRRDVTTLRFTKVAETALLNTSVKVKSYAATTDNPSDANWNGIANPAVFHANMDGLGTASSIAWEYNPDYSEDSSNPYKKIFLNSQDIILGQAFFAQVPTPQTLVVEPSYSSPSPVRRRLRESHETDSHYQVLIAREGGESTDDVIIRMDEEKEEDTYVIGTDLVRMGMSTMRPQLWVNRYDEKLCVNVIAPTNGQAEYPLGIFAPADGEYIISVAERSNEETTLYLTYDGRAVWDLSYGEYVASLEQGNDSHYGLRLVQKSPQVATGIDEAVVDAHGDTKKVLIDNIVYIVRGEKVYSIDGRIVK